MKKVISTLFLCLSVCLGARAQVFIINDDVFRGRMSDIKATVLDSLTNEPVAFASVYVVPSKDTTITNFTLTDAKGEAKLDEVPFGSYVFHVEMMGYKPFVKEKYFRNEEVDMGTIRLQVDQQFLQAATVTDVGNPIVVKKDTVEFNASSFRVGANAMLKDLLKRMPGMEITEDGKVKFNGEEIDKLTVGGRTFFFNDQSTALNNLPAAVVDKIRVIDRESEETRASGIQDGQREKVLDVALKKEYEKGWFGNVGLKGGATVDAKKDDDPLRDDRGLLYNGNALVSAYSEKDQVTFIANGQNINDSNVIVVFMDDEGEEFSSLDQGLSSAAQLGVNANTSRIKDVDTALSSNYKYSDSDSGTRTTRTTFQDDGNLTSLSEQRGKQFANSVSANAELEKEKGKVWFHLRPSFQYNWRSGLSTGTTETGREGRFLNRSENASRSQTASRDASIRSDVTFRELGGKKNRTLRLNVDYSYSGDDGESAESSVLTTEGGRDTRTMTYRSDGRTTYLGGGIRYSEPFGEKWTLSTAAEFSGGRSRNIRDAFDGAGRNDYYSSESRRFILNQEYSLTAQYKFGESTWITVGGNLSGRLNEVFSKSYGIEDMTGKDEWNWFLTPEFRFQHSQGNDRITLSASGYTNTPGVSQMRPVLNIGNPSRLSLGNVYLRPYSETFLSADWTRNNREKFSTLMMYAFGEVYAHRITSALWYDGDGILYSLPVNARKPSLSGSLTVNYTTPLDAKKIWSLSLSGAVGLSSSVSYQARKTLPGLDRDTFDYSDFMSGFWGNAEGDRFYGGQSGFGESRTRSFSPTGGITLRYNYEGGSFSVGPRLSGRIARYSLDPRANLNTLDTYLTARGSYTTKHEFDFETDLSYVFYTGYAEGYGQPEWQWNAEIAKSIGAFNLSVTVHDILNQTRNLTHTVTANYEEDTYRLVMGRYVLFGVKWNFGKMNAAHSARAQQAALDMIF